MGDNKDEAKDAHKMGDNDDKIRDAPKVSKVTIGTESVKTINSETGTLPQVRIGSQSPLIYPVGANVHIDCPAYDDQTDLLFFEWSRPLDHIIEENSRIRTTSKGVLKIKSAISTDSGIYFCKAINGFGTVTTNVTLQIVTNEDLQSLNSPMDNLYPRDDYQSLIESNINYNYNEKPVVSEQVVRELPTPVVIIKSAGLSVNMNCSANRVRWLKNGHHLTLRHLPEGSHKSGGLLTLSKVRLIDRGNYTCVDNRKPELTGFHPINTSVALGDKAMFHCNVSSDTKPHIQWLKRAKFVNSDEAIKRRLVKIKSNLYKVIKTTQVIDNGDGNYYNNLVIEKTQLSDSGEYICLAANTVGSFEFTFKSTRLTVLSPQLSTDDNTDYEPSFLSDSNIFWILITLILSVAMILVAILCYLQKRQQIEANVNRNINNNIESEDTEAETQKREFTNYYFKHNSNTSYNSALIPNQMNGNYYANR
ncbi:unnamed protein product [Oppiella nova]|uniref:receptor protein-tyrosine kinase n=1 Tax=Oppiella nova TaxID=334625 RepID=A0A7R9LLB9_9ACAR|nr:unnamed protein product [Oppiella nova]CAG2164782.1 unnamed protein product [Oppiella nova]